SAEASVEYLQVTNGVRVRLRGTGFYDYFSSAIFGLTSGVNPGDEKLQTSPIHLYGGEGEVQVQPAHRTFAWLNLSFFQARQLVPGAVSEALTDLPQARFNLGASLPLGDLF